MTGPIIVGVDGPDAVAAATLAASLAPRLGRELVLVHVAADPPVFPYGDRRLKEVQRRRAIAGGARLLTEVADAADALSAQRVVAFGQPAERLATMAGGREADLLVVGSRARRVLARALLGGVSGTLAATSPCPVVVVPNELDDDALRDAIHGPLLLGADGTQRGPSHRTRPALGNAAPRRRHARWQLALRLGCPAPHRDDLVPVVVVPRSSISHDELAPAA